MPLSAEQWPVVYHAEFIYLVTRLADFTRINPHSRHMMIAVPRRRRSSISR